MRYFFKQDGDETRHRQVDVPADADMAALIDMGLDDTWTELPAMPRRFEQWSEAEQAFVLDVAAIDAELHGKIDAGAGALRLQFITDIPGQQATYQRKEAQARACVTGEPGPFPLLEREAEATDKDLKALAAEVVAIADYWIALDDQVEATRRAAKQAVSAAVTVSDKLAAADVDWKAIVAAAS